jgi:catechol 2,3-dioxygenase-like lactoylglutathione lyase family enzyme
VIALQRLGVVFVVADVAASLDFYLGRLGCAECFRGVAIEVPPTDFWYGLREFSLRDPDGNRLTFAEPQPLRASNAKASA